VGTRLFNWCPSGALDLVTKDLRIAGTVFHSKHARQPLAEFLDSRWFVRTSTAGAVEVLDCTSEELVPFVLDGPRGYRESIERGLSLPARHVMRLFGHWQCDAAAIGGGHAAVLEHGTVTRYWIRGGSHEAARPTAPC